MTVEPTREASPEDIRAARTIEARPLGWWGMMLTIPVMATMYGAMYFSYVYIRVGVTRWPPAGLDPPVLGLPALSAGALVASAVVLWAGLRRSSRAALAAERLGLTGALLLAGAHIALVLLDWGRAGFGVAVHSYAGLYYVLPSIHFSSLAIAMVMAAVHLALSFRPTDLPRRGVGLRALEAYWYFLAIGGTGVLAVVYLTPHVWPVT